MVYPVIKRWSDVTLFKLHFLFHYFSLFTLESEGKKKRGTQLWDLDANFKIFPQGLQFERLIPNFNG